MFVFVLIHIDFLLHLNMINLRYCCYCCPNFRWPLTTIICLSSLHFHIYVMFGRITQSYVGWCVCDWIVVWKLHGNVYIWRWSVATVVLLVLWHAKGTSERIIQSNGAREGRQNGHDYKSCMFINLFLRLWCVRRVRTPFSILILAK